ncbi:MAG: response regulator transcription factor [Chloroflexi bacterium]|nr:response regulator transcription factor [Chloroflexota bacterium]
MPNIVIVSAQPDRVQNLSLDLARHGLDCPVISSNEKILQYLEDDSPDLVLIDIASVAVESNRWLLSNTIKEHFNCSVIGLLTRNSLDDIEVTVPIDDFVMEPWDSAEVALRIRRALWRTTNIEGDSIIKYGDLVIDLDKYEVSVSGRLINLSFKEYELLKVLVTNKDRVLTREAILDKVWGYDYFGGDRTVDVHIRRLRSKIEDAHHSFIDTVRNVGYKFIV